MIKRKSGFTLVELIIVMGILGLVLAAMSGTLTGLLNQQRQQSKISESNIEGIIGLEILRQDIERAGYGLPWVIPSTVAYNEASEASASAYNDCSGSTPCSPPRQIMSDYNYTSGWSDGTNHPPDLLVIKATNIVRKAAAQKSTYLSSALTPTGYKQWDVQSENLTSADYVIVLSQGSTANNMRTLFSGGTAIAFTPTNISANMPTITDPLPRFVYGIGDSAGRMPFNRADYYVSQTTVVVPQRCAPNTGVLVKSMISQSDGSRKDHLPLLDCVADMKVIFQLDPGNGILTPTDVLNDPSGTALTPAQIRAQLKEVRVYILAQEGQKDNSYVYPQSSITVGEFGLGHVYNIGTNVNYRWKLYTLAIKPKNL